MARPQDRPGVLVLEDGRRFVGRLSGPVESGTGEIVFTTNLAGYQEVVTDPSYAGQIVVMTAPMMGNYGVAPGDSQASRPRVAGFVSRCLSSARHSWRAEEDFPSWLGRHGVPAIHGVDTRAVTRHVRSSGAMRAVLCPAEWDEARISAAIEAEPPMEGRDLATSVSTSQPWELPAAGPSRGLVACLDYGVKRQSLDLLADAGFDVRVLPAGTSVEEIQALRPAGVFVSNGPGDPAAVPGAAEKVRRLAETSVPVFGICLGCQILALAFGARTWKLPYGHRGGNHPVRNLDTGAVEITSQNHGFAVVADGEVIPGAPELRVTHVSLNDGTVEGLAHRSLPVFAVQYHPEAAPGPHDSRYLFERFVEAMGANRALPTG